MIKFMKDVQDVRIYNYTHTLQDQEAFIPLLIDDLQIISIQKGSLSLVLYDEHNTLVLKIVDNAVLHKDEDVIMRYTRDSVVIKKPDNSIFVKISKHGKSITLDKMLIYYNALCIILTNKDFIVVNPYDEITRIPQPTDKSCCAVAINPKKQNKNFAPSVVIPTVLRIRQKIF